MYETATIIEIISNLGFPIAMCFYMVWSMQKTHERYNEEKSELTKIIMNNTVALTKLTERIEAGFHLRDRKEDED